MKSQIKKLPQSQIETEIEVTSEDFSRLIDQATLQLGQNLKVEGFRPGKIPKEIINQKIGKENILVEAVDLAVKENYKKFISENNIEPVGHPDIDISKTPTQGSPFFFRVKVAILPEIKLPDYRKIAAAAKKKKVSVEKREVEEALRWLQKSRAKFTLKNGPAEKGDFVEIEYWSSAVPGPLENTGQQDAFILGEGGLLPGFEDVLVGMKASEEKKDIPFSWPENHRLKDLAGKSAKFRIKMKSVQIAELPEINDDFARSAGNFQDLQDLKKNITAGIMSEKETDQSQKIRAEILAKINAAVECESPQILVENESKRMFDAFKKNIEEKMKTPFSDYLTRSQKSEKEILESFSGEAVKRIKNFLTLRQIIKEEKIQAQEQEIADETDKILKHYQGEKRAEQEVDLEQLRAYTKEAIQNEKVFQILEALAQNDK